MIWIVFTAALAAAPTTLPTCAASPTHSAELSELFVSVPDTGSAIDRSKEFSKVLGKLQKIDKQGGICSVDEHYSAAKLFLRSAAPADHLRAHELGIIVAYQRDPRGRELVAWGLDQHYVSQGKPQRFGTQFEVRKGNRCLIEMDESFSDADRQAWTQPTLAETYAKVLKDAGVVGEPTADVLRRSKLLCKPVAWKR